jgi:hypothetical protein
MMAVTIDQTCQNVAAATIGALRATMSPVPCALAIIDADGRVATGVLDDDSVVDGATYISHDDVVYKQNNKHKKLPPFERKESFCPHPAPRLEPEIELRQASWRVGTSNQKYRFHPDHGFFRLLPDNTGGWHGHPVRSGDVDSIILRTWKREASIAVRDMKTWAS